MTTQTEAQRLANCLEIYAENHEPDSWVLAKAIKLTQSAAELRRLKAANAALMREAWDWSKVLEAEIATNTALKKTNAELLTALVKADEFIDGIREDLHHERVTDWYSEGASNAAQAMSESMRLIGNRCADFVVAGAAIAKHKGTS